MQLPIFPLDNKYRLIRSLGEGGFGHVWLAEDVLIKGRKVAIKHLKSDAVDNASQFIEEMHHLSSLDDPHIVKFLHHFEDEESLYLVMEYCAGGTVDLFMRQQPLDQARVFAWAKTLTETLAAVHRHGIVHHDIKPQNLLLTDDGRLKLADFGVANRNWGTRIYMAPELSLGEASSDDVRIDVYALGVTLLELLLGHNPLRNLAGADLLHTKIKHNFIPSRLEAWVQELLLKATHPTPELRFQSMSDFGEAITSQHVPYVLNADRIKAHSLAEKAAVLLARKKWMAAQKCIFDALYVVPDCVAALIVAGRIELMLKRIAQAKTYFFEAVKINPRVHLQKELGWIALDEGNYPQAISMLTDHLQRNAADFEACNLLMACFFKTERYALGSDLAAAIIAQGGSNQCFESNRFLFHLLLGDPQKFLVTHNKSEFTNPFMRLNFEVATEVHKSWSSTAGPTLQSKLLFQDYRFGAIEKHNNTQTMYIDCGDGYDYSLQTKLISIGRNAANNIPFDQSGISRRHAVIVNQPGDVWIYDLGSVCGTFVDGERVHGKFFLDGVHTIDIGTRQIRVASDKGLLI